MFFKQGSIVERFLSTATSGGTLTLTASSETYQIFTGTQSHTLKLPNATTLSVGRRFEVINSSTGTITVQDDGSNVIGTLDTSVSKIFRLTDNSSANGAYDITSAAGSGGAGTLSAADQKGFNVASISNYNTFSKKLKVAPEEVGGNYWLTKMTSPSSKSYAGAAALNGFFYSVGGYNGSLSINVNERFNIDNNNWVSRAVLPAIRETHTCNNADGFVYAVGGTTTGNDAQTTNYQYSDTNDAWLTRQALASGRGFPGSFSLLNRLYVFQGLSNVYTDNTAEYYDNTNNVWITLPNVPYAARSSRGLSMNNKGFVVAGAQFAGPVSSVYAHDPVNNSWLLSTSLLNARHNHAAFELNGFAYVAGGEASPGPAYSTLVEEYSDITRTWVNKANMPQNGGSGRQPIGANVNGLGITTNGTDSGSPSAQCDTYINTAYVNLGALDKSSVLNSAAVSILINEIASKMPVQIRTDGDNWNQVVSGESLPKFGETLKSKLIPSPKVFIIGGNTTVESGANESYDNSTNAWTSKTAMTTPRSQVSGFAVDGVSYMVGSAALTNANESYNEDTNTWTNKAVLPISNGYAANFHVENYGYVCGGQAGAQTTNYRYDGSANAWALRTALSVGGYLAVGLGLNGLGYAIGGASDSNITQEYDPVSNSWTARGDLPALRGYFRNGFSMNDFGYFAGGDNSSFGGAANADVYKYNPVSRTWSTTTSLNTAVWGPAECTSQNLGYVVGGSVAPYPTSVNNNQQFNDVTVAWTNRNGMTTARRAAAAGFTGSARVFEMRIGIPALFAGLGSISFKAIANMNTAKSGGFTVRLENKTYSWEMTSQVGDSYDDSTNAWIQVTPMSASLTSGAHFALLGLAYAVTGAISPAVSTVIRYNPATRSWASVTGVNTASNRLYGGGRALNSYGYKLGGFLDPGGVQTPVVERYNPATNSWSNVASLSNNNTSDMSTGGTVDGFIYRQCGFNNVGASNSNITEQYNDAGNVWTSKANYPLTTASVTAKEVGSTLLSMNGYSGVYNNDIYQYSPTMNLYTFKGTAPWAGRSSSSFDSKIMAGGSTGAVQMDAYKFNESIKNAVLSAGLIVS